MDSGCLRRCLLGRGTNLVAGRLPSEPARHHRTQACGACLYQSFGVDTARRLM